MKDILEMKRSHNKHVEKLRHRNQNNALNQQQKSKKTTS